MSVSEIKFDCPECDEGLAIDRRAIGHQVACPFCKAPIMVPDIPAPAEIAPEPIPPVQREAASLAELASSRPEISEKPVEPAARGKAPSEPPAGEVPAAPAKSGGLPPKRKPGEKPKAAAEGPDAAAGGAAAVSMPTNRPSTPIPPAGAPKTAAPSEAPVAPRESRRVEEPSGAVPDGFEEKVRRKRKRRNPDEHRLNPRDKPKMVTFDEALGDNSFKKHPGHGKMPFWKKLGVGVSILGTLAAIGLGILKKKQLEAPDENLKPVELTELEKQFEVAKSRLDEFREASSVAEKMSFVRAPITQMEGYPPLAERMDAYYGKHTLNSHFPTLTRSSTAKIEQGDAKFLRILMEERRVDSYLYFEDSAAGYALDWDSFVGYNPIGWTEFLIDPTREAQSGIFRLIFTQNDVYTGIYQDKTKYRSYAVTDINSQISAIAYVVRGTAAEEAIEAEFQKLKMRDDQRVLMMAKLDLVERAVDGSHLTYIDKIIRSSWLLP